MPGNGEGRGGDGHVSDLLAGLDVADVDHRVLRRGRQQLAVVAERDGPGIVNETLLQTKAFFTIFFVQKGGKSSGVKKVCPFCSPDWPLEPGERSDAGELVDVPERDQGVCAADGEVPPGGVKLDADAVSRVRLQHSRQLHRGIGVHVDQALTVRQEEQVASLVPGDLVHLELELLLAPNLSRRREICDVSIEKNITGYSYPTLCVLASMKETRSSLLPTAMVFPSGDQSMLMFSPRVETEATHLEARASHILTLRSGEAVARRSGLVGCQHSWSTLSEWPLYVVSLEKK